MTNPKWRPFKFNQWTNRVKPEDKDKMILKPITGKAYHCQQEVQKDWDGYKEFYFPGKGYFSKADFETMQISHEHLKGQEIFVKFRKGESCVVAVL